MAGETVITVIGNLTADPELRWTQAGAAVADFTVASTPRTYDRNAGEWRDGDTLFMRVIVQGRLTQRSYDTQHGERRTVVELQVDEVGPSLRRARAQVTRVQAQAASAPSASASASGGAAGWGQEAPQHDPWGAPAAPSEPPF